MRQDYPYIEWIFVDGDSTDNTLKYIRSLNRPYTLIENVSEGISNAMNAGLMAASGDIVLHLHSDDYLYRKDVLTKVAQHFNNTRCAWMFGRVRLSVQGKEIPEKYSPPRFSYSNLLIRNFIPHAATFVRREALLSVGGFDTSLKYAMDYDMWLKLTPAVGLPLEIFEPLAVFREHSGSLSTRERLPAMEEEFMVRMKYAGNNVLNIAAHYARYLIRKRQILRRSKHNFQAGAAPI